MQEKNEDYLYVRIKEICFFLSKIIRTTYSAGVDVKLNLSILSCGNCGSSGSWCGLPSSAGMPVGLQWVKNTHSRYKILLGTRCDSWGWCCEGWESMIIVGLSNSVCSVILWKSAQRLDIKFLPYLGPHLYNLGKKMPLILIMLKYVQ